MNKLFSDLRKWGGLQQEQILHNLNKNDLNNIVKVMNQIEEGLTQLQQTESRYQDQVSQFKKTNDTQALKKLESSEKIKRDKRLEAIKDI